MPSQDAGRQIRGRKSVLTRKGLAFATIFGLIETSDGLAEPCNMKSGQMSCQRLKYNGASVVRESPYLGSPNLPHSRRQNEVVEVLGPWVTDAVGYKWWLVCTEPTQFGGEG